MSRKRTISALLMTGVAVCSVIFDIVFVAVVLFLTAVGLYEFFHMIKKKEIPIYSYTGIFIGIMIPASILFRFELTKNWELLFTVLAFLMILLLQFARKDNHNAIVGISTTLFGVLYVSWFFSFVVKVRMLLPDAEGKQLLAFLLIVTKMGDIGALMIGERLGRHPLFSRISPKKSIEGSLGGILMSILMAITFRSFLPIQLQYNLFHVALMGAFFGMIGQLGDLSESLIKRDCHVKDSGKLLPGMGGVLDAIDSILFSAPVFYLYVSAALGSVS